MMMMMMTTSPLSQTEISSASDAEEDDDNHFSSNTEWFNMRLGFDCTMGDKIEAKKSFSSSDNLLLVLKS